MADGGYNGRNSPTLDDERALGNCNCMGLRTAYREMIGAVGLHNPKIVIDRVRRMLANMVVNE
jgi:hypothetical protein